jgi:hypothetical protein
MIAGLASISVYDPLGENKNSLSTSFSLFVVVVGFAHHLALINVAGPRDELDPNGRLLSLSACETAAFCV